MNDEFIYAKKINENYFLMDLFCKYMDPMLSSLFSFPKVQIKFWKMKQHVNREEDSLVYTSTCRSHPFTEIQATAY